MAFNPGIVKKIMDGLGTQPINKISPDIQVVYVCNDDKALVGVHPHEFLGVARRVSVSGDGASTTLTLTPPADTIWLIDRMLFTAGAAADTINSLQVDGEEVDVYDIQSNLVAAANTQTIFGLADGAARGVILNTTQYPMFQRSIVCRRNIVCGLTAASQTGTRFRAFVHQRNITPQER